MIRNATNLLHFIRESEKVLFTTPIYIHHQNSTSQRASRQSAYFVINAVGGIHLFSFFFQIIASCHFIHANSLKHVQKTSIYFLINSRKMSLNFKLRNSNFLELSIMNFLIVKFAIERLCECKLANIDFLRGSDHK
jgi:hypothetical protein